MRSKRVEDTILVYVAGNPDAYPLEYYDSASETYQGVIPQLFAQFSAQSNYEIVYYAPDKSDQRSHLARNLQVDLLSGYAEGEELPPETEEIVLFHTRYQGNERSYYLCFTKAAPESLRTDLQQFLSAVSQEEISGLLMESAAVAPNADSPTVGMGALVLCAALLAGILVLVMCRHRRQIKKIRRELECDRTTGLGRFDELSRAWSQKVTEKTRILYHLIYFYLDTDHLHRMAGGQVTEEVLRHCAEILREYSRQDDILARVAEDGFVLLRFSENQEPNSVWIATALQKIRAYCPEHNKAFEIDIAAGVYPMSMGGQDLEEILFLAGQEARHALAVRKDVSVFTDEARKRLQLEKKLRDTVAQALDGNEFQLYVQFYVDASTDQIVGGEALSRWFHPERGLLLPGMFVPFLEREGQISKLDYHCLQSACRFLQTLCDRGVQDFFLSCNFSRDTFAASDFPQRCREILNQYQFPRELLIFELTESTAGPGFSQIRSNMLLLKEYGVRIALDDFGEGFTSFADLQEYPADGIKLDKAFIDHVLTKPGNAIVRAMIQVGHELGITILAEGVETEPQAMALREAQCDVIQGFQFHAPIPEAEAIERILKAKRAGNR